MKQARLKAGKGLLIQAAALLVAIVGGCSKQPGPSTELGQIQVVAEQLLRSSQVQVTPIRFGIQLGDAAPYWAEKAGLCKSSKEEQEAGDACANWEVLSPGQVGTAAERRLARNAYVLGSANARTYSHGVITFDRSFFLVHDNDQPALRCVVAHELIHFLHHHAFLDARAEATTYKDLTEEERNKSMATVAQEQELEADRGAMLMVALSGHDPKACIAELQSSSLLDADYAIEDPTGTHPGYERRLAAAEAYLHGPLQADIKAAKQQQASRKPKYQNFLKWSWDSEHELLRAQTTPNS